MDDVLAVLAGLDVPHEVVPCDPALADTAEFCAHYGYELADSANAIVVVGKGDPRLYAMCVSFVLACSNSKGARWSWHGLGIPSRAALRSTSRALT